MPTLDGATIERLRDLICNTYDYGDLKDLLSLRLKYDVDQKLERRPYTGQVLDLINAFSRTSEIKALVLHLWADRPISPEWDEVATAILSPAILRSLHAKLAACEQARVGLEERVKELTGRREHLDVELAQVKKELEERTTRLANMPQQLESERRRTRRHRALMLLAAVVVATATGFGGFCLGARDVSARLDQARASAAAEQASAVGAAAERIASAERKVVAWEFVNGFELLPESEPVPHVRGIDFANFHRGEGNTTWPWDQYKATARDAAPPQQVQFRVATDQTWRATALVRSGRPGNWAVAADLAATKSAWVEGGFATPFPLPACQKGDTVRLVISVRDGKNVANPAPVPVWLRRVSDQ